MTINPKSSGIVSENSISNALTFKFQWNTTANTSGTVEIWMRYTCNSFFNLQYTLIQTGPAATGSLTVTPGIYALDWTFKVVRGGVETSNFLVTVDDSPNHVTLVPDEYHPYRPSYFTGFSLGGNEEVPYNDSRNVYISPTRTECSSIKLIPSDAVVTFSIIGGSEYATLVHPTSNEVVGSYTGLISAPPKIVFNGAIPPPTGGEVVIEASYDGYSKTKIYLVNPIESFVFGFTRGGGIYHNDEKYLFLFAVDRNGEEVVLSADEKLIFTLDSTQFGIFYDGTDSSEELHVTYGKLATENIVKYVFNGEPIRRRTPVKMTAKLERDPTIIGNKTLELSQRISHLITRTDPNPIKPGERTKIIVQPQDPDSNDVELPAFAYDFAALRIWYNDTTYGKFVVENSLPLTNMGNEYSLSHGHTLEKNESAAIPEPNLAKLKLKYPKVFEKTASPSRATRGIADENEAAIPIEGQYYIETKFPGPGEVKIAFESNGGPINLPHSIEFKAVQYYTYFGYSKGFAGTGKVRIQNESKLDHFDVQITPDSIRHNDGGKIFVTAKDKSNNNIPLDGNTPMYFSLGNNGAKYGNIRYGAGEGKTLDNIAYSIATSGLVYYIANGENPDGPTQFGVGVTGAGNEGTGYAYVTPIVEKFCQTDSRWTKTNYDNFVFKKKDKSGDSTDAKGNKVYYKIGQVGCALTCMAMIAKAGGAKTDPAILNQDMIDKNKFGTSGNVGWGAINNYKGNLKYSLDNSFGVGLKKNKKGKYDPSISKKEDLSKIDNSLANGSLVIAQVYNPNSGNQHWVLITTKQNGKYKMIDPQTCAENEDASLSLFGNNAYRFIIYSKI